LHGLPFTGLHATYSAVLFSGFPDHALYEDFLRRFGNLLPPGKRPTYPVVNKQQVFMVALPEKKFDSFFTVYLIDIFCCHLGNGQQQTNECVC
jgi:hypothetical protein